MTLHCLEGNWAELMTHAQMILRDAGKKISWLMFGGLLMLPLSVGAQSWNWRMEDVDSQGSSSSLIADRQGNLHLSYYVSQGGLVKYGFRPAGDSKWYTMSIDNNLGVLETQITVDSQDNPHICYTPRIMKYAHWDGRRWQIQEVDPGTGLIAYVCSIQVSSDGKPMISWYLESGTYLRYAVLQDGVWVARSIEGGDSFPGKWSSMALDAGPAESNPFSATVVSG